MRFAVIWWAKPVSTIHVSALDNHDHYLTEHFVDQCWFVQLLEQENVVVDCLVRKNCSCNNNQEQYNPFFFTNLANNKTRILTIVSPIIAIWCSMSSLIIYLTFWWNCKLVVCITILVAIFIWTTTKEVTSILKLMTLPISRRKNVVIIDATF